MDDCAFCDIAAGELDVDRIAETAETVAFLDGDPATLGHLLVAPKAHSEFLFADENANAAAVFEMTERVVDALNETLEPDGISLFHTSGPLVGSVSHAHVHLIPRFENDHIHLTLERERVDPDDAAALATELREHL